MINEQITKARDIVTDWLGMFDPPPQIDFQQSEFLQQAIVTALHGAAQRSPEQLTMCRDQFARVVAENDNLKLELQLAIVERNEARSHLASARKALEDVDKHLDNFGYQKNMKARKIISAALKDISHG